MNKLLFFLMVAPLLLATSCTETEDVTDTDVDQTYVVLGRYFGMCGGEQCVEIFKITDSDIFEDQKDEYPNGLYNGDWEKINKEIAINPDKILEVIPDTMRNDPNKTYGMPDAYDQGGQYLEIIKDGDRIYWMIDMDTSNLPAYLIPVHNKVNEVTGKLQ